MTDRMLSWAEMAHHIDTSPNKWVLAYAAPQLKDDADHINPKDHQVLGSCDSIAFWTGRASMLDCTPHYAEAKLLAFDEALGWAKTFKQRYGYKWPCQPVPSWMAQRVQVWKS